jgi:hypothetical protein
VVWNGSLWVAGGQGTNTLAYSTDGITWSASTNGNSIFITSGSTNAEVDGIAWNGSLWVAIGYKNLSGSTNSPAGAYSYDGINWFSSSNFSTFGSLGVSVASKPAPNLYPPR